MSNSTTLFNIENVVSINEILKNVINTATRIDLVAFNAVLVAKRAGIESVGFHVVAHELRSFGKTIEKEMMILGVLIQKLVQHIANVNKLKKSLLLLDRASFQSDQAHLAIQDKLTMKRNSVQDALSEGEADWRKLETQIRSALTLCRRGAMLSHSGKIEASYGKMLREDMNQITVEIDEIMHHVVSDLKQLNTTMS